MVRATAAVLGPELPHLQRPVLGGGDERALRGERHRRDGVAVLGRQRVEPSPAVRSQTNTSRPAAVAAYFPSGLIAMAVTADVWKSAGSCFGVRRQLERVGQVPDADLAVVGPGDGEDRLRAGGRAGDARGPGPGAAGCAGFRRGPSPGRGSGPRPSPSRRAPRRRPAAGPRGRSPPRRRRPCRWCPQ